MIAASVSAFAAAGDFTGTAETTITATNLTAGDTIGYFQLIQWNSTKSDWELTNTGESCGVALANLLDGISEAEASTIATSVTGAGTAMTVTADANGKTATADATVAPGLYFLRAVPAADNKSTVYNPAFVSADYYEGGNSINLLTGYTDTATLKKSDVPFDKDVVGTDKFVDTKPGDIIPYVITTEIPSYGSSFTHPKFTITDTFSTGLELELDTVDGTAHPITVAYGASSATASNDDVTITAVDGSNTFTVAFTEEYLTGLDGATPEVSITYFGKVNTEALNNVTYMDNKAKLTFSNSPDSERDKEDITRHYTFSIDGNILGQTDKRGSELIKTGTDADGHILTETRETFHEHEVSYLNGATFKLEGIAGTNTAGVEKTFETNGKGHITFNGLDAGTYKLTEVSAPTGFIKDSREFTVTITPTYDTTTPDLLVSYQITITSPADETTGTPAYNGGATFNMTNEGGTTVQSTIESDSNFINNTQGKGLPSTGGMGTTILYVGGSILVILAAVLLITKRRMNAND